MQITIDEYSQRYKMSKEMIRAKIRAGRLKHAVIDGTVYIQMPQTATPPTQTTSNPSVTANAIIAMYQKENAHLKAKIDTLEQKIDRLIEDKERMLRDERDRVEAIYVSRDEQLKTVLELVNTKLMQERFSHIPESTQPTQPPEPSAKKLQSVLAIQPLPSEGRIELLRFLEAHQYDPSQIKTVLKRFARAYGNDIRVVQQNGEFVLDFAKYDYADLLAR